MQIRTHVPVFVKAYPEEGMEKENQRKIEAMMPDGGMALTSIPYEGAEEDWRLFASLSADERTMVVEYTRKLLESNRNRQKGEVQSA